MRRSLEALRAQGRSIDASRFPGPGSLPRPRQIREESAAFFDFRNRLFSDLLADAARIWLVERATELDPAVRE